MSKLSTSRKQLELASTQGGNPAKRRRINAVRLGAVFGVVALASQFGACSPTGGGGSQVGNNGGSASNGGSSIGGFENGGSSSGGDNFGGSSFVDANGGSGASGGSGQDACAADNYGGKQIPLDMYVMLDRSGSMDGPSWTAVVGALTDFVQSPDSDGVGIGLQFFPSPTEPTCPIFAPCGNSCTNNGGFCEMCDPNGFLPPAVPFNTLPGAAAGIVNAMNGTSPGGDTPTMPALQSAAIATTAYAKQHPDRKVIIVLASDGVPSRCEDGIPQIAAVAAAALAETPSVETYAIGIGDIAALDAIAAAGGSQKAIVVDTATGSQDFLDAMNEIRGQALGCEYLMPTPTEGEADPDKLNVRYTPDGSPEEVFPRVNDVSQCQGQPGWYYDDPANPTKITLCPASCDRVKNLGGSVSIELGCEQIVAPPR
ncbi:MAG: VWA domain-containing protein [Polyangiaceae bacterium]|nr:VWA domain-containing protein [Polyangiaceae bacterium]